LNAGHQSLDVVRQGHFVRRKSIDIPSVGFTLFFDFIFSFPSLAFGLFDFPEGLDVDVDVEDDGGVLFSVVFADLSSFGLVVNDEVFAVLFGFEVYSSDVGVVVLHCEGVHLHHVGIHLSEILEQFFLELFFGEGFRFG
jgi:hypothetical protein